MTRGAGAGVGDLLCVFFSSRRRHTRLQGDWSSDVCSSDLDQGSDRARRPRGRAPAVGGGPRGGRVRRSHAQGPRGAPGPGDRRVRRPPAGGEDRKSTRLNSSHLVISYAVFCLKKKKQNKNAPVVTNTDVRIHTTLKNNTRVHPPITPIHNKHITIQHLPISLSTVYTLRSTLHC